MDLGGWNFDPSMLSSLAWSDNNTEHGEKNTKKKTTEASPTGSLPAHLDSRNWVGNLALLSNFGDQEYEGAICSQRAMSSYIDRDDRNASQTAQAMETDTIVTQSKPQSEASASIHTVSDAQSMNSGSRDSGTSSVASRATSQTSSMSSSAGGPQLHPMAIQSSATCPPHSSASGTGDSSNVVRANQYLHLSTGRMPIGQNHQASSDSFGLHGIDSAALASLAAAFQNPSAQSNNHISSLAANFMLAHAKPADTEKVCLDSTRQLGSTTRSHSFSGSSTSAAPTVASSVQQSRQHSKQSSTKPPPFYLFDAPIELRANFMQNQRKLGLPIQHDPNSYHYGETVKGFHPQNLMNQEQVMDVAANTQANQIQEAPVQLIDARHGNLRPSFSGRVKNEREQKRAQKITELIDQLRIDMERGGCKVEMRSKFHTLSQ